MHMNHAEVHHECENVMAAMEPDSSSASSDSDPFLDFSTVQSSADLLNHSNTCPLTIPTQTWGSHSRSPSRARGIGMARKHPPIQRMLARHKCRIVKLRKGQRDKLAAALQQEYCRRRARIKGDKRALQILNEQYGNVQYFVTPSHRLPAEILMNIFYIIFDDQPSPVVLMLVCRRWHNATEEIPGLQTSLKLHTWTTPDLLRRATSGVTHRLLNITIDTDQDQDQDLGGSSIERYSTIAIAIESIPQWRSLTVHSLPGGKQLDDSALHKILSTDIPPMTRLEELRITSDMDPSPLVEPLLQSIAATAMSGLTTMETKCLYSSQFLLRVTSACTFHSLTTLKAVLPKRSEPINILPLFTRLEVLEVTNLCLPSYQNDYPLPFTQILRRLSLKSVTIDWMGGRVFQLLSFCAIVTPPSPFLAHDAHLPTCREFHLSHHCTTLFARFQVPMASSLAVHSNHWTPLQGSQGLVDLCIAGLGTVLRPRVLHLAMLCNGSVLLTALRDLPALEELHLTLPRPSALGRGFFTSLLAKPVTIPYRTRKRDWFAWAENQNDWRAALCPSLKVFNLHYQRWLRPNEQIGFVAPLLALGWSRHKTEFPLQTLCVHMKAGNGDWKRVELVFVKPEHLLELDISQLQYLRLERRALPFVFQAYLTSATLSVIEGPNHIATIPHLTEAIFGVSFNRIRVLRIRDPKMICTLNVLHCFYHLEELSLDGVRTVLYSNDADFPLLRTLQRLSIRGGRVKWMDGLTFVQLKYFSVWLLSSWYNSFPKRVDMPICTRIFYPTKDLQFLSIFQAAFLFPLMHKWTLQSNDFQESSVEVVHALSRVHARVLRLSCRIETPQLVMVIRPRYKLEELSVELYDQAMAREFFVALTEVIVHDSLKRTTNTLFNTQGIPKLEDAIDRTFNKPEGKMICPNLKVLGFQFWGIRDEARDEARDEVRQWCVEMMEGRRCSGCPLDRCCIWWDDHGIDWEKEPSLVLTTSNEG